MTHPIQPPTHDDLRERFHATTVYAGEALDRFELGCADPERYPEMQRVIGAANLLLQRLLDAMPLDPSKRPDGDTLTEAAAP